MTPARALARFDLGLGLVLLAGLLQRLLYLRAQPEFDPTFAAPAQDGAYYVDWARDLAAGATGPEGAFYLAPLFPWLVAGLFRLVGEQFALLYFLQHLTTLATALLLALTARRIAGAPAGLATAGLLLLYHPALYLASRPLGEPVGLMFLSLSLWLVVHPRRRTAFGAGAAAAVGVLARPNLLLAPLAWSAIDFARRHRLRAVAILAGVLLVLLPVALRNRAASGHLVPVSANAGMTLYHGNGPGARTSGVIPPGFSGEVAKQREESTRLATLRSGKPLDPVEADRFWGLEALRVRAAEPLGTLKLWIRRGLMLGSSREVGLAYAPSIDANPWRFLAPIPYGLILGLALVGIWLGQERRREQIYVWAAIFTAAASPLLFYTTSRYRLPVAVLLCIPAGVGVGSWIRSNARRRGQGAIAVVAVAVASYLIPVGDAVRIGEASALVSRGWSWQELGDEGKARGDLERALALDPEHERAYFNLGVLEERAAHAPLAERHYRRALALQPSFVEPAINLAGILLHDERPEEALELLERALIFRPYDKDLWTRVVGAYYVKADATDARAAIARAVAAGVVLDPEFIRTVEEGLDAWSARPTNRPVPSRTDD